MSGKSADGDTFAIGQRLNLVPSLRRSQVYLIYILLLGIGVDIASVYSFQEYSQGSSMHADSTDELDEVQVHVDITICFLQLSFVVCILLVLAAAAEE